MVQERRQSTGSAGGGWGDHLPEEVQEVNSAAEWKTGCEKGRDWTGSRLLGEGRLSLAALTHRLQLCTCSWPSPGNRSAFTLSHCSVNACSDREQDDISVIV